MQNEEPKGIILNMASAFLSMCRKQGLNDKEIVANMNDIFSRKETFNNTGWYKSVKL